MFAVVSVAANAEALNSVFDVADNKELLAKKVSELIVQSVGTWEQQVKHAQSFAVTNRADSATILMWFLCLDSRSPVSKVPAVARCADRSIWRH